MNKPDVEVKLQRYQVRHAWESSTMEAVGMPDPLPDHEEGDYYRVLDVDPLLESKDSRIQELEEFVGRVANPNQHGDPTHGEYAGLRNAARTLLSEEKPL